MKLKSKMIIINIVILSLAFGISSYLILKNSYEQTLSTEIDNCLEQNKMINSMYQIKILQMISSNNYAGLDSLKEITVASSMSRDKDEQVIVDEQGEIIVGTVDAKRHIDNLIKNHKENEQTYLIYSEDQIESYIVGISGLSVGTSKVYVVNKYEISEILNGLEEQQDNLKKVLFITLLLSCMCIYIATTHMTNPINKLVEGIQDIANGNFQTRTNIKTKDEVGKLSESFDDMAGKVQYYIEKIEHENEVKETFMANFTHELKTPLTTVIGYADLLRRGDVEDDLRIESADYIFTEANRLQKMSMKLLDFFMLGKEKLSLQKMYLPTLLEEAVDSVKESYKKEKKSIKLDVDEFYAMGEYELMKTGLINLLDNSRKASSMGQLVEVSTKRIEDKIAIIITDYGIGIHEEELGRITEAFYMVDKSRTRKEGGAGLGLSLVATIVNAINGSMKIESSYGEGTKVCIILKEVHHEN